MTRRALLKSLALALFAAPWSWLPEGVRADTIRRPERFLRIGDDVIPLYEGMTIGDLMGAINSTPNLLACFDGNGGLTIGRRGSNGPDFLRAGPDMRIVAEFGWIPPTFEE